MIIGQAISSAIHWWCADRNGKLNHNVNALLPFVFYTLDSLYLSTRKLPLPSTTTKRYGTMSMGGTQSYVINMPDYAYYADIRLSLALVSDLYFQLESLIAQGNLLEIEPFVKQMQVNSRKFGDIRNFFTHLDEMLVELYEHGINGSTTTKCGITYTSTAKECFHLVVEGDGMIHFSHEHKAKEISVNRTVFDDIFTNARNIYSEITNHKIHATSYPSPTLVYPS